MSPLDHAVQIGAILDSLGIPWVLGGSMASSFVGEPRSTVDIDVAIQIRVDQVTALVDAVKRDYYVSEATVRHSLRGGSFNLIHFESNTKIDVFPLSDGLLDHRQISRRVRVSVGPGTELWIGAADDQLLRKLRWYPSGGEVSERQWRDVVSILRVQGDRIDRDALHEVATELGLVDLLRTAIAEADR